MTLVTNVFYAQGISMTMRRLLLLVSVVALAACSSTPSSRIEHQRSAYERYPAEVQRKISAGEIDIGFTPEQVRLALGEPTRKSTRKTDTGDAEVWGYGKSGPAFSIGIGGGSFGHSGFGGGGAVSTGTGGSYDKDEKLRVVFRNGAVTEIEQTVK
ncbi:MAG: hypothetical protein M0Q15_03150 [Nevskia sp.]|jgi:hypothetical protein|nr:hypothetical protein [Nevskia sp.]